MNKKEMILIIKNYKPHKGFFDLSKKPEQLSDYEYAKILKTQNFLAEQNKNIKYLKKFNMVQFTELQNLSAELQNIILGYWGDSVFI